MRLRSAGSRNNGVFKVWHVVRVPSPAPPQLSPTTAGFCLSMPYWISSIFLSPLEYIQERKLARMGKRRRKRRKGLGVGKSKSLDDSLCMVLCEWVRVSIWAWLERDAEQICKKGRQVICHSACPPLISSSHLSLLLFTKLFSSSLSPKDQCNGSLFVEEGIKKERGNTPKLSFYPLEQRSEEKSSPPRAKTNTPTHKLQCLCPKSDVQAWTVFSCFYFTSELQKQKGKAPGQRFNFYHMTRCTGFGDGIDNKGTTDDKHCGSSSFCYDE